MAIGSLAPAAQLGLHCLGGLLRGRSSSCLIAWPVRAPCTAQPGGTLAPWLCMAASLLQARWPEPASQTQHLLTWAACADLPEPQPVFAMLCRQG